jgi:hypothetical protein
MFHNLDKLARALGCDGITLEFLQQMQGQVGAFTRLAVSHNLPAEVGVAAKREFIHLMELGATMFAVAEGEKV